jgi:hypothetical protein
MTLTRFERNQCVGETVATTDTHRAVKCHLNTKGWILN